jgi:hypothetical protein
MLQNYSICTHYTVVRGQDRQIINSKYKNRILGKTFLQKKGFLYGEKENFEEYSIYLEYAKLSFKKNKK